MPSRLHVESSFWLVLWTFFSGSVASFLPLSQRCACPSLNIPQQELVHGSTLPVVVLSIFSPADAWDRPLRHLGKFTHLHTQEVSVGAAGSNQSEIEYCLPPMNGAYSLYGALRT